MVMKNLNKLKVIGIGQWDMIVSCQSTVGKMMAAVHFTTIPCEPNTVYKTQGKPNFYSICSCTKEYVHRMFEDFITLLYLFMNVVKVSVR